MWLGGKTFSESRFRWLNQWIMPHPVRVSEKVSIAGKTIVFAQAQQGGREIILAGWLTQAEYQEFLDLYEQTGQDFTLIFDSGIQFQNVVIMSVESNAVLGKQDPNWINLIANLKTVTF